jgi:hypothetical protein
MIHVLFTLSLIAETGAESLAIGSEQNPQDFQLPAPAVAESLRSPVADTPAGGLKKEHQLQAAQIEGDIVAPQGFQDFKDVVPRSRRLLEERLQFKLWEATRLGY